MNYINCTVPASESLRKYIEELAVRAEEVKSGSVARTEDNMLKITTDGRKAALDMRLVVRQVWGILIRFQNGKYPDRYFL